MKVLSVVGARPNFMKIAPVHQALLDSGHIAKLVHTGQHYDTNMSRVFFDELGMPQPDANLNVGGGSHATQTAHVMLGFEPFLLSMRPDTVLVAGDVNSTVACALVAVKLGYPVAHLEAGLRSWDRTMPEEINRVVTDHMSDVLLTPSADADDNLRREGLPSSCIHRVGNAMIDTLQQHLRRAQKLTPALLDKLRVHPEHYALVTLHRPANVDDRVVLGGIMSALLQLSEYLPVLFPAHPRTRNRLLEWDLLPTAAQAGLRMTEPLGYLEFLALQAAAQMILTDSGGIQEESTALGVPCLTLRPNTERPVTVSEGTNTVVGTKPQSIVAAALNILDNGGKSGRVPALWDGQTADRVVRVLAG